MRSIYIKYYEKEKKERETILILFQEDTSAAKWKDEAATTKVNEIKLKRTPFRFDENTF